MKSMAKKQFLITILILTLVAFFAVPFTAYAASGSIKTSDINLSQNANVTYDIKDDVYVRSDGLPEGNYWIRVLQTQGDTVLGTSSTPNFTVDSTGNLTGPNVLQVQDGDEVVSIVQLTSLVTFGDSINGVYKVEVTIDELDEDPDWNGAKSDNFKVADASIRLVKTVDPGIVNSTGASVAYSFTVVNDGNVDLTGVVLTDDTIGATIDIGNLSAGEDFTTDVPFNLGTLSSSDWVNDEFENQAEVIGYYNNTQVDDTDNATVIFTDEYITPGGIRVIKDVPNVTDSNVSFQFDVYDMQQNLVAQGFASEIGNLEIGNLSPGTYVVEEDYTEGYDTENSSQQVSVPSGDYTEVTFVNTLRVETTPGAIEIIKDVPNVTDSAALFNFSIYYGEELIATGSAAEIDSLLIDNLQRGEYTVIEDADPAYHTDHLTQSVTVNSEGTAKVTFINTLINNPETRDAAIQIQKSVSPTTVSSRGADVTFTFTITNTGDYDFYEVIFDDLPIGEYFDVGSLTAGETTTRAITFDLSLLGTSTYGDWTGNTFTNTVSVTGYYGEEQSATDTDDAIVTFNSGGGGGGGGGGGNTTVPDEPTPASPVDVTPIIEDPIPAAPLPQTGGVPGALFIAIGSLLAGGGMLIKKRKNNI